MLLISVRSGTAVSMPGMIETVLDVGVNDPTVQGLMRATGNPRLAWDSYRRLIQGFAEVVQSLPTEPFDALICDAVAACGAENERQLDRAALRQLVQSMLACVHDLTGAPVPAIAGRHPILKFLISKPDSATLRKAASALSCVA